MRTARQQRGLHRVHEPGPGQRLRQPGVRPVHEPGRHVLPQQHRDQSGRPPGRHIPETGQRHRRRVQHRPETDPVHQPARRHRRGDLSAAGALTLWQREFRPPPDHLDVPLLRPRRPGVLGSAQPRPAPAAPGRRLEPLTPLRIRIPDQTTPGMTRLPTTLAVLRPLPQRGAGVPLLLPRSTSGLTPRPRLDRLLRGRGARIVTASPQTTLQIRDPQRLSLHHRQQPGVLDIHKPLQRLPLREPHRLRLNHRDQLGHLDIPQMPQRHQFDVRDTYP